MALLRSPELYGYTIFCDDIRMEADGKVTFVGSYGGQMLVHASFPLTLPKFGFGVTLIQRRKDFVPNIVIRIFLPGDPDDAPSIQTQLAEGQEGAVIAGVETMVKNTDPAAKHPDDEQNIGMHANLIFAPLVIKQPGQIRVRALRNDDLVRLGAMRISAIPNSQATAAS